MNKKILTTSIIAGTMIGLVGCGPTGNATGTITETNAKSVAQPISMTVQNSKDIVDGFKKINIKGFKHMSNGIFGKLAAGKLMKSIVYNHVGPEVDSCSNGGTANIENNDTSGDGNIDTVSVTFASCNEGNTIANGTIVVSITEANGDVTYKMTVDDLNATNQTEQSELSVKDFDGTLIMSKADHAIKSIVAKGSKLLAKHGSDEAKLSSLDANMTGNPEHNATINISNTTGYVKNADVKNDYDIASTKFTYVHGHYVALDTDVTFESTPSCFNGSIGVKTNKTIKISDSSDTEGKITEGEITFTASNSDLTITSNTDGSFDISGADTKHLADQDALEDYFDTNDSTSCQAE